LIDVLIIRIRIMWIT